MRAASFAAGWGRRARALLASAVVVGVAAPLLGVLPGPVAVASSPLRGPVLTVDAPDPEVVADGGGFVVFTTNAWTDHGFANVPTHRWEPGGDWQWAGDALPRLPDWTAAGYTWAPGAFEAAGRWVLYFVAPYRDSGRQCIGVATAPRAEGPYVAVGSEPLICQLDRGGSIDPSPYVDEQGRPHLAWKSDDNAIGRPTVLWTAALSDDGARLTGPARALLRSSARWEAGVVENPELVHRGGRWHLFYSGGRWESAGYGIGWATCDGPLGPCTKRTTASAWLDAGDGVSGPGGASVVDWDGTAQLVFHAWHGAVGYRNGGIRALHAEAVGIADIPTLRPDLPSIGRPDPRRTIEQRETNLPMSGAATVRHGGLGGTHLACDFDGTGTDRLVWVQAGRWYRHDRRTDDPDAVLHMGRAGDRFVCGDVDGDGRDEPGVVRDGYWIIGGVGFHFGTGSDVPVLGDWDGDGRDGPGVHRPSNGWFFLRNALRNGDVDHAHRFGRPGDTGLAGDWDGDGGTEIGVRRGDTFHLGVDLRLAAAPLRFTHGPPDAPVVTGDWTGDGVTEVATVR